ncbi:unnamed protein product, partial [marine sediment metagenome]
VQKGYEQAIAEKKRRLMFSAQATYEPKATSYKGDRDEKK